MVLSWNGLKLRFIYFGPFIKIVHCHCTVHFNVVHFCDSEWSFGVKANLGMCFIILYRFKSGLTWEIQLSREKEKYYTNKCTSKQRFYPKHCSKSISYTQVFELYVLTNQKTINVLDSYVLCHKMASDNDKLSIP